MTIRHLPQKNPARSRASHRGISLVELMVALAIGLVVIGAVLVSYLGASLNGQQSTSLAQMSEDATVSLNLLRTQIAMAGYSRPIGTTAGTDASGATVEMLNRAYKGFNNDSNDFIVGCDGGFDDVKATDLDISALACASGGNAATDPDALAVAYEADASNTTILSSTTVPTDCLGTALQPRTDGTNTFYVASNRFYIDTDDKTELKELYCQGNGVGASAVAATAAPPGNAAVSANAQPLVENIVDLQITYGIANTQTVGGKTIVLKTASRYLTATQVRALANPVSAGAGAGAPPSTDLWNRVVSVRLCVEVRSANPAAPGENDLNLGRYVNCQGTTVDKPADGHLHRSFWTTVVLHNRI